MEYPVIDSQRKQQRDQARDWYSVSVDTLRAWGVLLALAVLALVGFFGYRYWESHDLQRRASAVIGEARQLMNRLQGEAVVDDFRSEYQSAIDSLGQASAAFGRSEYAVALDQGRRSRSLLESIIDADLPLAVRSLDDERGVRGEGRTWEIRCGVGVGEVAADRPAVADLPVADL